MGSMQFINKQTAWIYEKRTIVYCALYQICRVLIFLHKTCLPEDIRWMFLQPSNRCRYLQGH